MKNKILALFLGAISIFGINKTATAATAPTSLNTGNAVAITQYVSGYQAYLKTTADGSRYFFCENAGLNFPSYKTVTLGSEVDKGFVYIINNKPNTGDSNKNFYIMQMAIWWYKDVLTGSNANLNSSFKTTCTNSTDSTCKAIYNLVQGARNYSDPRGTLGFSAGAVTFTESGGYYVSNAITLTSTNLSAIDTPTLVGAPYGSSIINNTITSSNKNGSFQVRVPVSSVTAGNAINFSVEINGNYGTASAFDYIYNASYQRVIYDQIFTVDHPIYASKSMSIKIEEESTLPPPPPEHNSLIIYKVDQDGTAFSGAGLTLYKGNCVNTTCSSSNVYASWTSNFQPKTFADVPVGVYTIVETNTPSGYRTAIKDTINVSSTTGIYQYVVVNVKENEKKPVVISKTDVTGEKEIPGATLIIKDLTGKVIEQWESESTSKYIVLEAGEYTLSEKFPPEGYKLSNTIIYFKVDEEGNAYVKNSSGVYALVNYIRFVNEPNNKIMISKLDKSTNAFLPGANLVIKNLFGDTIASWTTGTESYYIALEPGEYTLTETFAPAGFVINTNIIYFKVLEDGTVMVKNDSGVYELENGIIIYNIREVHEEIIKVPKTGLSSALTYITGSITLIGGAWMLIKNGKFN